MRRPRTDDPHYGASGRVAGSVSPLCEAMTMDSMSIHLNHGIIPDGRHHPVTSPEVKELFVTGETPEVVTAIAGDTAAGDDIQLVLPETACARPVPTRSELRRLRAAAKPLHPRRSMPTALLARTPRPARDRLRMRLDKGTRTHPGECCRIRRLLLKFAHVEPRRQISGG